MRNIANVVHDLKPIVAYLKEKVADLQDTTNPDDFLALLSNIAHDATMLELYLEALEKDAKAQGLNKI